MVGSPCINICEIQNNMCIGCYRDLATISSWSTMNDSEKTAWWDKRNICYAGIGSRDTPEELRGDLTDFSYHLENMGYCLRSGAAKGADQAFEKNIKRKEIFVAELKPAKHKPQKTKGLNNISPPLVKKAFELAQQHHGGWHNLSDYSKKLMARNCMQVLGETLDRPVDFVLCWAEKVYYDDHGLIKNVSGGTGMAVRLAYSLGIPVIHTHLPQFSPFHDSIQQEDFKRLHQLCQQLTRHELLQTFLQENACEAPSPIKHHMQASDSGNGVKKLRWKRG